MLSFKKLKGGRSAGDYYLTKSVTEEVAEVTFWNPNSSFMKHGETVDPAKLRDLLEGFAPAESPIRETLERQGDGPELVRNAGSKSRIAGYDITFSAPKSVSVMMAAAELVGDEKLFRELDAACRLACDEALEFLKNHGAFRVGLMPGETRPAEDIVVARVAHRTSRNGDPQTHYHNVVLNLGIRTVDGEARVNALQSSAILDRLDSASEHSHAALSGRLVELGFRVVRTEKAIEIDGVDEGLCRAMSSRRSGAEKAARLRGYENPTPAQLERMIRETRKPKREASIDERYRDWLEKFADQQIEPQSVIDQARGLGREPLFPYVYDPFTEKTTIFTNGGRAFTIHDAFFEVSETASQPLRSPSPSISATLPVNARSELLREIREKLETGHSTISYSDALKAAASVARGRLDAEGAKTLLHDALRSGDGVIPVIGKDGQQVLDKDGDPIFTTPELRDAERRLLANSLGRANERDWIPNRSRTLERVIRKNEEEVGFKVCIRREPRLGGLDTGLFCRVPVPRKQFWQA